MHLHQVEGLRHFIKIRGWSEGCFWASGFGSGYRHRRLPDEVRKLKKLYARWPKTVINLTPIGQHYRVLVQVLQVGAGHFIERKKREVGPKLDYRTRIAQVIRLAERNPPIALHWDFERGRHHVCVDLNGQIPLQVFGPEKVEIFLPNGQQKMTIGIVAHPGLEPFVVDFVRHLHQKIFQKVVCRNKRIAHIVNAGQVAVGQQTIAAEVVEVNGQYFGAGIPVGIFDVFSGYLHPRSQGQRSADFGGGTVLVGLLSVILNRRLHHEITFALNVFQHVGFPNAVKHQARYHLQGRVGVAPYRNGIETAEGFVGFCPQGRGIVLKNFIQKLPKTTRK